MRSFFPQRTLHGFDLIDGKEVASGDYPAEISVPFDDGIAPGQTYSVLITTTSNNRNSSMQIFNVTTGKLRSA